MDKKQIQEARIELVDTIDTYNREYRKQRHQVIMLRNKQGQCKKRKNIEHAEAYQESIVQKLNELNAIRETAKNMARMLIKLYELERKAG